MDLPFYLSLGILTSLLRERNNFDNSLSSSGNLLGMTMFVKSGNDLCVELDCVSVTMQEQLPKQL